MATANDRFSQTRHSTVPSPEPGLLRHPVETENGGENGYARSGPSNGSARQEREPAQQRFGPRQGQKAGAVNGKVEGGLDQFASDRETSHTRSPHGRKRNVSRHNRSAWSYLKRRMIAVVDVLNLGWGTYLVGLVLVHFLI